MKLNYRTVNKYSEDDLGFLYLLLASRQANENISHNSMPSFSSHRIFVENCPYQVWYIIQLSNDVSIIDIGAYYITKQYEIGINIVPEFRGNGYGKEVINHIILDTTCRPYYANINPANEKSIKLFEKAGFKHIQNTYKLD